MSYKIFDNIILTLEDFTNNECQSILNNLDEMSFLSCSDYLLNLSSEKVKNNEFILGKIFFLIGNACSMILIPNSRNEPFKPYIELYEDNKRSLIVDDFSLEEIQFFESILRYCKNYKIKCRLADILVLVKKTKNINYIDIAINNYQYFSLEYDELLIDSYNAWERAIRLCLWYKRPLTSIQLKLFETFMNLENDAYYLYKLESLLSISRIDEIYHTKIMNKLEETAKYFHNINDFKKARDYYKISKNWVIDNDKLFELTIKIAELYILDAKQSNELLAGDLYENAIKEYRKIPRKNRNKYNIDEKINSVHRKMNEANKFSLDYMQNINSEKVDLSNLISEGKKFVSNKSLLKSLNSFINMYTLKSFDTRKEKVLNSKKGFLCEMFFGNEKHISSDGRIIGRMDKNHTNYNFYYMFEDYNIELQILINGLLVPAYQQILYEHRITRKKLFNLLSESSILPSGREDLWIEGIFFGFEHNFVVSSHLLIPQIEHLIRVIMKKNGIKTSTLDNIGLETENSLSTLLNDKKIDEIIDKNLLFELKALLTEQLGMNLRNNIAHGLCSYDTLNSYKGFYLWWFCLKLLINYLPAKDLKD